MTREDVIEEAYANDFFKVIKWVEKDYEFDFEPVRDFLNKIFDNLENRVCKNCKYFNIRDNVCKLNEITMLINKDFGCNKFELKDYK